MKYLKGANTVALTKNVLFFKLSFVMNHFFTMKVSFDHYRLLIRYSRFHNLLIDVQAC